MDSVTKNPSLELADWLKYQIWLKSESRGKLITFVPQLLTAISPSDK